MVSSIPLSLHLTQAELEKTQQLGPTQELVSVRSESVEENEIR